MNEKFYDHIFEKHQQVDAVPSNKEITRWALQVIRLLFPEQQRQDFFDALQVREEFDRLQRELAVIMNATKACEDCDKEFYDPKRTKGEEPKIGNKVWLSHDHIPSDHPSLKLLHKRLGPSEVLEEIGINSNYQRVCRSTQFSIPRDSLFTHPMK